MAEDHDGQPEVAYAIGDVVSGTVIDIDDDGWLWLDVKGWGGAVIPQELNLADGESARDRYAVSETIAGLCVWGVDHDDLFLSLSLKRNAPGYLEALEQCAVGDVVSGTITSAGNGLWLNVSGLVGYVLPWDLALTDGESARDRYAVGEMIDGLFIWDVDHEARILHISIKRAAPGYVQALQRRAVGDIVSGTITGIADEGIQLDVGGLVGLVLLWELGLAEGESAWEHYTVGETINNLLVWGINHETREIYSSLKRNTPGYVEVLQRRTAGEIVSGTIIYVETAGLALEVHGVVGVIPASELQLEAEQSPQQRYSVGDIIAARVWMIDPMSRVVILSVGRHAADFREETVAQGAIIDAVVRGTTPRGVRMPIRVLTMYSGADWVEIPPHALSLSTGMPPRFEDNQAIRVVVVELDDEGRPTRLSHQQALDGWEAETRRLSPGTLIPNARPLPPVALSDAELRVGTVAVDLGPITGFVPEEELDHEAGQNVATYNETYPVVIESVDRERGIAIVSHDRFEERWRELVAGFEVGGEVAGELRDFDGETALLDVGSGLLAQMPARELPDSEPPGKAVFDRIGERFPLRITAIDRDSQTVHVEPRDRWVEALLDATESETLEFKAVLRGSGGKSERRNMTHEAMRTITGFLNTSGGNLVIGVDDDREVVGLESDNGLVGETVAKKIDRAIQTLEDNIKNVQPLNALDDLHDDMVKRTTHRVNRKTLLVVRCQRGPYAGVWLVGKGQPEFWIRKGQETVQLRGVRMPIRVLTMYSGADWVEIPPHALSLSTGMPPRFEDNQAIRVVVVELDDEGRPTRLSHQQALDGWEAETRRLSPGTLIPNARPLPPVALSDAELRVGTVAVDLGPITGFVPEEELDHEAGQNVATYNETYPVVIESVDRERGIAIVSHDRFEERWRELVAGFEVGGEVAGELRDFDGETALLDVGSGLLAQMPARELPDSEPPGKAVFDRIGERFPLRITAIDRDSQTVHVEPRDRWVEALLDATESETLEFKAVLRGSGGKSERRNMTHEAMRTITGFLNTSGGNLVIGVDDDREVVGLESDNGLVGETVAKKIDRAIQTLEDNIKNVQPLNALDDLHDDMVKRTTHRVNRKTLLVVRCQRGPYAGVWLVGKGQPEFWIRKGQETVQLRGRDAIRAHLSDRGQRAAAADDAASVG